MVKTSSIYALWYELWDSLVFVVMYRKLHSIPVFLLITSYHEDSFLTFLHLLRWLKDITSTQAYDIYFFMSKYWTKLTSCDISFLFMLHGFCYIRWVSLLKFAILISLFIRSVDVSFGWFWRCVDIDLINGVVPNAPFFCNTGKV